MKHAALLVLLLQIAAAGSVVAEDSIWTSKPVPVDPAKQDFERLPDRVMGVEGGEPISFPIKIDMQDSASFTAGGAAFVLEDLKGISANRLCTSETGARWSCGAEARLFVGNLFRGRTLVCKVTRQPEKTLLSQCRNSRMNIPFEIVSRGFAFPHDEDGDLQQALMKAKAQARGVWRDVACFTSHLSC